MRAWSGSSTSRGQLGGGLKVTVRADDTRVKRRSTGLEPNSRLERQRPKHVGKKIERTDKPSS